MNLSTFKKKKSNLPKSPGVYEFYDKQGEILYIGKATNLKDRVGSYYANLRIDANPRIANMISQVTDIKIRKTDSVLEALILESNLIKKHQPKYNIEGKDDKSFVYAVITREIFPRILIVRETELETQNSKLKTQSHSSKIKTKKISNTSYQPPATKIYGPYTSKRNLEIALKLIRKIFPYHSAKKISKNCCFDFQIGLCPGPYVGAISKKDYLKNIRNIEMILKGEKKRLVSTLKKDMKEYAKNHEYEKAAEARNQIFALTHIRDIALISKDMITSESSTLGGSKLRIEGYDISNIGGDYAVGSMAVFTDGKADKDEYRKFKIKTIAGVDDVGMMREVLRRRFQNDWPKPDLIFVDGGKGHLNMAQNVAQEYGHDIPVVAVAKGLTRKKADMYYNKEAVIFQNIISDQRLVERIRNEAHRFAIVYHKKLRRKNWREK